MARINHQNNFATTLTSNVNAGDTTSPLNAIPSIDAPFYLAFDADNINGHYEVKACTSKTATNVNHAALTYAHTTAEEVRLIVPAEEMNNLATLSDQVDGAWVAWTPTWTNLTVGAGGTVVAKYTQVGKLVTARLRFVYGTGSAISGLITFTLPVTANSDYTNKSHISSVYMEDAGVSGYQGGLVSLSTTTAGIVTNKSDGTYVTNVSTSGTIPFTWATGDFFAVTFSYEAA